MLGGEFIADSTDARLLWERPHYPTYVFPSHHVRTDLLERLDETAAVGDVEADVHTVVVNGHEATGAARWFGRHAPDDLRDSLTFDWDAMDAWFEEDEQVYVHARDPYTRIDVLESSRHVRVEVDGLTVADSHRPRLLFETGLPVRYYLPKTDVRLDLLVDSDRRTRCPYKGEARHYSVEGPERVHRDLVWSYPYPTNEAAAIAGLVAFYDERVDLYVDGQHHAG